jgi:NAD(P)H dehydrogenase (quinone)
MANFIESTGGLWFKGALVGKVAGVFTSTGTMHGGNEATLLAMFRPLAHLGYIIVPMGYTDQNVMTTTRGGTPYGPSSVSNLGTPSPNDSELQIARAFGRRLAETTKKLRG